MYSIRTSLVFFLIFTAVSSFAAYKLVVAAYADTDYEVYLEEAPLDSKVRKD